MWQKFEDWLEKKENVLNTIFLFVIPAIVGVVSATIGFLEKGFLGSLAGFIRGVLGTYLIYLPIVSIYAVLSDRKSRENLGCIIMGVILCVVGYFLNWLLTNY